MATPMWRGPWSMLLCRTGPYSCDGHDGGVSGTPVDVESVPCWGGWSRVGSELLGHKLEGDNFGSGKCCHL